MKKLRCILVAFALATSMANAQRNCEEPILSGFYPDPSVCRVDSDYYMVNSSFCYYPSVPIHHSRDLIHWEPIGYCLTTESQANLRNVNFWGGIYAPTIRYYDGVFYMVTTNVSSRGNFIVYTDNPRGQWSEPVWLSQGGIDPSLYFEDGHCYLVSNPDVGIWLCEINPKTGEQLSESRLIWRGTGGRHPEAPHIYKKDGLYYLLIAEGGTEYGHKVTIARSESIYGSYESNPANPILTHIGRNAQSSPVQGTGHADLFEAVDGSWWLVCLGFRPQSYSHHLLGRETFLAPVRWDEGAWPVVNGNGTLVGEGMGEKVDNASATTETTIFSHLSSLPFEWNYVSYPRWECYSLTKRGLVIKSAPVSIESSDSPALVARRQQHISFEASTALDATEVVDGGEAGLAVYMSGNYHYRIGVVHRDSGYSVVLTDRLGMISHTIESPALSSPSVALRVVGSADAYAFSYSEDGGVTYKDLGAADSRFLSSETAGGFTGTFLALYSQAPVVGSAVTFSSFTYKHD